MIRTSSFLPRIAVFLVLFLAVSCGGPFRSGMKKMEDGKYQAAAAEFKKMAENSSQPHQKAKAYHLAAEAYRQANQPKQALPFFEEAVKLGFKEKDLGFHYATALKMAGQYEKATQEFKLYAQKGEDPYLRRRAMAELNYLPKLDSIMVEKDYIKVEQCEALNTAGEDYSPVWLNGKLVFTSAREGEIYEATGAGFTDIMMVEFDENNPCSGKPVSFSETLNLPGFHEASATFSRDGKTMVFARSNSGKKKDTNKEVNLYISYLRNGKWSEPEMLPFSDEQHWDACPAISADGNTLYFASDRPGGFGGVDIWSAKKNSRGVWAKITNMGKTINTPGNEMFPYVSEDARLYFASDAHPGMGGLDLFEAVRADGQITVANLGKPFNSTADDFALTYLPGMKKGFFSSNRVTDTSKGFDDIYYFVDTTPKVLINYYLAGVSKAEREGKKEFEVVSNVKLQLKSSEGALLEETTSDAEGNFKFNTQLQMGDAYVISGTLDQFINHTQTFETSGKAVNPADYAEQDSVDIVLTAEVLMVENIFREFEKTKEVTLNNILYDFGKADLRPEAKRELDILIEYLKSQPTLRVELGSHTDTRGGNRYNLKLSERRAQSAVEYILDNGLDPSRIVAKGYGETDLKVANAQTEEEHQQNRRTTIKLLPNEEKGVGID